MEVFRGD